MHCLQEWDGLVANGPALALQSTQQYIIGRAVHGALAAAAVAAAVAPGAVFAAAGGLAAGNEWHLLRCSCAHNNCYKILQTDTIRIALVRANNDPLSCPACPAHSDVCRTFSPYVVAFYAIMMQLWPNASVVWDWHDVPHLHRYHFDATVFVPQVQLSLARFEIDGPCHFKHNFSSRRQQDQAKDVTVDAWGYQ